MHTPTCITATGEYLLKPTKLATRASRLRWGGNLQDKDGAGREGGWSQLERKEEAKERERETEMEMTSA